MQLFQKDVTRIETSPFPSVASLTSLHSQVEVGPLPSDGVLVSGPTDAASLGRTDAASLGRTTMSGLV